MMHPPKGDMSVPIHARYPEASARATRLMAERHPIEPGDELIVLAAVMAQLFAEGYRTVDGHPFDRSEVARMLKWGRR